MAGSYCLIPCLFYDVISSTKGYPYLSVMQNNHWLSRSILILIPIIFLGFISKTSDRFFEISKNMEIYGKVFTEINTQYVDETSPTDLMRTGINAMLGSLDPYTNFFGESQIEYSKLIQSGQYGGIGSGVVKQGESIILVDLELDGPADKAGLKVGDILMMVDKEEVEGSDKTEDQVRSLLLGEKDSEVDLTIRRGGIVQNYTVIRGSNEGEQVDVPYFGMVNDSIGYILQLGFTGAASAEVRNAIEEMQKSHELKGLILDLRGNLGGRLDQAVDICNHFIPAGQLIVEMRGRAAENQNKFFTTHDPLAPDLPLAVLVNGRSASAAEIVAGGIQDLDRGVIIGTRSFGKGLVQKFRPLTQNTQMKITVAKYYTPSGRCIQAIDYSHRNEDGSVGKIPDSLIYAFKTSNGRTVYDGGGIEPDILVEKPPYSPVTQALIEQNLIFDFATSFSNSHDSIAPVREFDVNEDIYADFLAFVEERGFSFDTRSEQQMQELENQLKKDEYKELEPQLLAILLRLEKEKSEDLQKRKDEIIPLLREEIIRRFYLEPGVIESKFVHDADILKALNIFSNEKYLTEILGFTD
jgi:carboxyl-terminal processing protease